MLVNGLDRRLINHEGAESVQVLERTFCIVVSVILVECVGPQGLCRAHTARDICRTRSLAILVPLRSNGTLGGLLPLAPHFEGCVSLLDPIECSIQWTYDVALVGHCRISLVILQVLNHVPYCVVAGV